MFRGLIFIIIFFVVSTIFAAETIYIRDIKFVNNNVYSYQELKNIISPIINKNVTFEEIKKAVQDITKFYQKNGYMTSKAYLKKGAYNNGVLTITILEGKVGNVILEGSEKYFDKKFIRKFFKRLKKGDIYNQKKLEEVLLALSEIDGLEVSAKIVKSEIPNSSDIIIKYKESPPVHVSLGYNNYGSKYVSKNRYSLTFELGNAFAQGAKLIISGSKGDTFENTKSLSLSYSYPLGIKGSKVGAYYFEGNYDVGRELAVLDIVGKSKGFGLFLNYIIYKSRNKNLSAKASFDYSNAKQWALGQITSEDKIRTAELSLQYDIKTLRSKTLFSLSYTKGLKGFMDGTKDDEFFVSRKGASNDFNKWNFDFYSFYRMNKFWGLLLKGMAQYSKNTLFSSQEFYMGGANTVRGFTASEFSGDSGYVLSTEFRLFPESKYNFYNLAFFIDGGAVYKNDPQVGQKRCETAIGGGVGLRVNYKNFSSKIDVGMPITAVENKDGKSFVLYLSASLSF